ncbi:DinB family protein [bacterium]|nr:DinB family protein [bacterium]
MFHTFEEFITDYRFESETTKKVLEALSDESLGQRKGIGETTLGDIAWHIATTHGMMLNQAGFHVPANDKWMLPQGTSAAEVLAEYERAVTATIEEAAGKSPEELKKVYSMWGMAEWPVHVTLAMLISHEVHHRGQLSVLMRQAGLKVPSIYGPNYEETQEWIAKNAAEGGA